MAGNFRRRINRFALAGSVLVSTVATLSVSGITASSESPSTRESGPDARTKAIAENEDGLEFARKNELDHATHCYQLAIQYDPMFMGSYINLANTQFQQGRYEDARATIKSALIVDPTNYPIWMNAGVMTASTGDFSDAEVMLRKAGKYGGRKATSAWTSLAQTLIKASAVKGEPNRINEAIGYAKRAVDLDPRDSFAASVLRSADTMAPPPVDPSWKTATTNSADAKPFAQSTTRPLSLRAAATSGSFSVHGLVLDGGDFQLNHHHVSLLGAIAEAGWLPEDIDDGFVQVVRNEGGSRFTAIKRVKISDIQSGRSPDFAVHPEDEITVESLPATHLSTQPADSN